MFNKRIREFSALVDCLESFPNDSFKCSFLDLSSHLPLNLFKAKGTSLMWEVPLPRFRAAKEFLAQSEQICWLQKKRYFGELLNVRLPGIYLRQSCQMLH